MEKVICIDAGHGGSDSGAVGNGIKEKDITLKTALKAGEVLKKQGFDIIFTRVSDNYINLGERCRRANSKNADLFISFHTNSAENVNASGTETLCYKKNYLAEIIQKYLIDRLGTKDRGVKERKDLAVLNGTRMNAVLIEMAFISNFDDAKFLKSELFIENCVIAIAMAVCKYFGIEYKIDSGGTSEMKKSIDVIINGKKETVDGYFADGKNLFTSNFLRQLGFFVKYDENTKEVIIDDKVRSIDVIADGKKENVKAVFKNDFNYVSLRELERIGIINLDYKDGVVYINSI